MINPPPPAELLAELGRFRDRVAALPLDDAATWQTRPAPDEWSLGEVLCHLRDVEREVHQARIAAVLTEDRAFLQGVNADEWAEPRDYCNQDAPEAQADYLAARDATMATLRNLPAEAWQRQGQHTFFGPTTLQELVFLVVQHDRVHDKQIAALTEPLNPPA
jgi:uncharacterized damage-inducible protein DinB